MPTTLVTGGAGFLGSHLCEYLLEQGHRVICVDNLIVSTLENIEHLRDDGFEFREPRHDRSRSSSTRRSTTSSTSPRSPARSTTCACRSIRSRPARTARTTRSGSPSSSARGSCWRRRARCTAIREVHPQPESYWGNVNPIGPRGVYDEAKRYAEAMTMAYHRQQGVDTSIARIFNTYGPRMRPYDGRAIPTFIRQALEDKQLTVFGDGSQTRSFCYVDDLIRGLFAARRERRALAHESGQSGGIHDPRARGGRPPRDGIEERDRVRSASNRRPAGPPAGHHAGPRGARLGAGDRSRRGSTKNVGVTRP